MLRLSLLLLLCALLGIAQPSHAELDNNLLDRLTDVSRSAVRVQAWSEMKTLSDDEKRDLALGLIAKLASQDHFVRQNSLQALGMMNLVDDNIINALYKATRDADPGVSRAASVALAVLGQPGEIVIKALASELEPGKQPEDLKRYRAAADLKLIAMSPRHISIKEAIPALMAALSGDPAPIVRSQAAATLGFAAAKEALPTLEAAAKDNDTNVRHLSEWAIAQIQKSKN